MKIVLLSALVMGGAVLWTDVDTQVARYNVENYLSGTLEQVDVYYLRTLGSGAVPQLHRLATQAQDETVREKAADALTTMAYRYRLTDVRAWNWTQAAAEEILELYELDEP
jgi:hypothetical protein